MSTISLASLNVDVLSHLIEFVDPVDRFNLILSGILRGFENLSKRIDLRERIQHVHISLGVCRNSICELEIRSLAIIDPPDGSAGTSKELPKIMELLADEGRLKNNCALVVDTERPLGPRFLQIKCSMTNLKILDIMEYELKFSDLACLFQSCAKLIELRMKLSQCINSEIDEDCRSHIRLGFQRLRWFELVCILVNSWELVQEILPYLKECVDLSVHCLRSNYGRPITMQLNPDFTRNLRILNMFSVPTDFAQWILLACSSICTLNFELLELSSAAYSKEINQNIRLEELKELYVKVLNARYLEMFRNCRNVKILRVNASVASLTDFAELESAENLNEAHLSWKEGPSIEEMLPILKRWRFLRRVSLQCRSVPHVDVMCDFIMKMKHLTCLQLAVICAQPETLSDQIKEKVLPRRPNFQLTIKALKSE